jgi:D-alanyl-lipoteichoic acid acyltransferase DltB (MBOAT superfamily)
MSITSLAFAGFVLAVLMLYYVLPGKSQKFLLLAASYIFYISWDWRFAITLALVTVFNFFFSRSLRQLRSQETAPSAGGRSKKGKRLLWLGILINLAALLFFKQSGFFLHGFQALLSRLGFPNQIGILEILLPVGMSFYILQAISFLVDTYQNQIPATVNFMDLALYLAYFPKLLSGPIERAGSFLPKLSERVVVDNQRITESITRILIGLVRKIVIADVLAARIPANFFSSPSTFSSIELIFWWIAYIISLYNDFAGYTSIARGVSGLFGIELSPNFDNPFFSTSITELWNHWHMSLSQWLRNYVYMPLSRYMLRFNQSGRYLPNIIVPALVTMVLSGLWHGESWNFVLWGALMGIWIAAERIRTVYRPAGENLANLPPWHPRRIFSWAGFLIVIFLIAIPFKFDIANSIVFWRSLVTNWFPPPSLLGWRLPLIAFIPAIFIDWIQFGKHDELIFIRWKPIVQSVLLALCVLLIFLAFHAEPPQQFIYQGF